MLFSLFISSCESESESFNFLISALLMIVRFLSNESFSEDKILSISFELLLLLLLFLYNIVLLSKAFSSKKFLLFDK